MATSDPDLVDEVRSFGQYSIETVDDSGLNVAVSRAKSHLLAESQMQSEDVDWYEDPKQEEALFWTSMLFSKVQTQALGAKAISVGEIQESALLASSDGDVTMWYRNYKKAKNSLVAEQNGSRITGLSRTSNEGNRYYTKTDEL